MGGGLVTTNTTNSSSGFKPGSTKSINKPLKNSNSKYTKGLWNTGKTGNDSDFETPLYKNLFKNKNYI